MLSYFLIKALDSQRRIYILKGNNISDASSKPFSVISSNQSAVAPSFCGIIYTSLSFVRVCTLSCNSPYLNFGLDNCPLLPLNKQD